MFEGHMSYIGMEERMMSPAVRVVALLVALVVGISSPGAHLLLGSVQVSGDAG
jgi:hypothetical protein